MRARGRRITFGTKPQTRNNYAYFRKTFVVTGKPELAKVYVTAYNDYRLYCNGQLLRSWRGVVPAITTGNTMPTIISILIKSGTNVFAATGHWRNGWNNAGVDAQPAFLFEARFDYSDGSSSTIGSDESWKVLAHTAFIEARPANLIGNPWDRTIQFDSRREPAGWKNVDFDDSQWASATVVDRSNYHLFAQMAPMEREQGLNSKIPVSITSTNGAWLVDFWTLH